MSDEGKIVTVEGPIEPEELGITLPHEHVFFDMAHGWFKDPKSSRQRRIANEPLSLENLGYVRLNVLRHRDNMVLDSFDEAVDELSKFRNAGGSTIVDVSPKEVGGDPELVRKVGRAVGIQVVHGTSYYTRPAHPARIDDMSQEELEEEFISDVLNGIDDTEIRAGLVGEIGISGRIHEEEEKILRAGSRAAARTGASLNIHPPGGKPGAEPDAELDGSYARSRWGLRLLDIVEEEGLSPDRVVMSHMDGTQYEDLTYQKELADRGAYLEYDIWGMEHRNLSYQDSYPSDTWRENAVLELIEEGYIEHLLFSHDVCLKIQRLKYGGFGYAHILDNIIPKLKARGLTQNQIDQIIIENPKKMLTFTQPIPG